MPAGEVTFKIFDEGTQYHYQARGETYDSYEWFFKAKDEYDSWVDKNTLLPNYSERNVNEGDYHIFEKISFNQAGRKMTVWRATKRGDTEERPSGNGPIRSGNYSAPHRSKFPARSLARLR